MKNLKFHKTAYFPNFLKNGAKLMDALCSLVSDLQTDRDVTVSKFLDHAGSEDFIWAILKLLGFQNEKIAGNAAYVIGTIADTNAGSERLVSIVSKSEEVGNRVLGDLLRLLRFSDDEIVLNGVGALGSLADSEAGRTWLCGASQFDDLLAKICSLVRHKNVWIGSNSALLLARLTILDTGLSKMLVHPLAREICTNLILSLGTDAAGRGMNAAFALGRIVDVSGGQELVSVLEEDLHKILVKSLSKMFQDRDVGTAKNALYALSCLAGQKPGSNLLATNRVIEAIAKHLTDMLLNDLADNELRWFCAMTLRSFACQQKTCLELKKLHFVYNNCKAALRMANLPDDIKDEIIDVFEFLKPLPQMSPPRAELTGPLTIKVEWDEMRLRGPFTARYSLFHRGESAEGKVIYSGPQLKFLLTDMKPYTQHIFQVRLLTDHEEGPLSEPVTIRTEEWLPGQVRNLHMVAHTATQVKVAWDEPQDPNGIIRHFVIYVDDNPVRAGRTEEQYFILQNLNQNNSQEKLQYTVHVAAVTGRGEGLRQSLEVTTAEAGECRPSKPTITVLGRSELYVTWNAPPNPPGKIIRYELTANNEVVYSGTELYATVTRLQPETEYSFQVVMFSNEGRFQSLAAKRVTPRDEFVAFNGPRTASSKGRRSAKSAGRTPPTKESSSSTSAEVQTNNNDGDQLSTIETSENVNENGSSGNENQVGDGEANRQASSDPPPPKPFTRSKTMMLTRNKSSSQRRQSQLFRRSLPPVQQKEPQTPGQGSASQTPPSAGDSPTSPGDFAMKRERSNTLGSKGDKDEAGVVVAVPKPRKNRSLSMVNKLLTSKTNSKEVKPQQAAVDRSLVVPTSKNDLRCSVVTLNLPEEPPSPFDFGNRWAYGVGIYRPDMISAQLSPFGGDPPIASPSKRAIVQPESVKRAATMVQIYPGQKQSDAIYVVPGTPAIGQRGLTMFNDNKDHFANIVSYTSSENRPSSRSVNVEREVVAQIQSSKFSSSPQRLFFVKQQNQQNQSQTTQQPRRHNSIAAALTHQHIVPAPPVNLLQ